MKKILTSILAGSLLIAGTVFSAELKVRVIIDGNPVPVAAYLSEITEDAPPTRPEQEADPEKITLNSNGQYQLNLYGVTFRDLADVIKILREMTGKDENK